MDCTVFVEDSHQVELALNNPDIKAFQWIALTTRAEWALESRNIEYIVLGKYASLDELDLESRRVIEKMEPFCARKGSFGELAGKHQKLIIDVGGEFLPKLAVQFEITLYRLNAYLEAEHPGEIVWFSSGELEPENPMDYRIPDLFAKCLHLLAVKRNVSFREIKYHKKFAVTSTEQIQSKPSSSPWWHSTISRLISFANRLITPKAVGDRRILLLSLAYDLEFIANSLIKSGEYPVYLYNCTEFPDPNQDPEVLNAPEVLRLKAGNIEKRNENHLKRIVDNFWEELRNSDWFRRSFYYNGIDYGSQMEDKLKTVFRDNIFTANLYYPKHLEMLERYKIKLILSPYPKMNPVAVSMWYAAEKLNIPIAVYQHGGNYGYKYITDSTFYEYGYMDIFLSYGSGLKEQLSWNNVYFNKIYQVGSLKLFHHRNHSRGNAARLREKLLGKKFRKLVTYASDIFIPCWTGHTHLDHNAVLYNFQKRLVNTFARFPDFLLVIKLHHSDKGYNPLDQYLLAGNISNCIIRYSPMFLEYTMASDLLILDNMGTAFIEALSLGTPMFSFSSGYKIYPEVKEELIKCMLYADDMDEFFERLNEKLEILVSGKGELMGEMDPRIRESILIDDKRVLERVDKVLEHLISLKEKGQKPESISFDEF